MSRTQRPDRKGFDKLLYEQHVERIRSMKPSVDNHPPRPHPLSNKCEIDKVIIPIFSTSNFNLLFLNF